MFLSTFKKIPKKPPTNVRTCSKVTTGTHIPYWLKKGHVPKFDTLTHNESADVCVIGGGISGLTSAYLLTLKGKSVVLLEDGEIVSGESGRTTAHLASAVDDRFFELETKFGLEGSRTMAQAHAAAVDQIEKIVKTEKIDCEFTRLPGYLFLAGGHKEDLLAKELKAADRAGLMVEWVDKVPVPGFQSGPALKFPNQGQVHPVRYLSQLAEAIKRNGGKIYSNTRVSKVEGHSGHLRMNEVSTFHGPVVRSENVIVATNVPINDRFTMYTKIEPYRTYVITAKVAKAAVPQGLYWDSGDPYHYVRLTSLDDKHDLLIVGGEDHLVGHTNIYEERYTRLFQWTKERFPVMNSSIQDKWSGQIIEPVDDVAFIGRNPGESRVFIVTGDSGNGMTHGTIAGMMFVDMVDGKTHPWEHLFDPSRKPFAETKEFVTHNLDVGKQYTDWITRGEVSSRDEIQPGHGAVLRKGLSKVAVYRDESGTLHEMSAICPHMKGIVHWNDDEKSWDCPVHGSRFSNVGRVLNGPANQGLAPQKEANSEPPSNRKAEEGEHHEMLPMFR